MEFEELFKRLGCSAHTHEVYQHLYESTKPVLVAHLALAVGVSRAQIYRNLDELLERRLVSVVHVGKRTGYRAESPRRIEEEFTRVMKRVTRSVESYTARREKELPQYIRFFTGFSGIRAVFDDVVAHTPKKDTFYRYTSERDLASVNKYLSPQYRKERDRRKLERLVISNPISGKQKKPRLERFIKYIQPEVNTFDQNIIQLVYGNRLAFINLNTEEAFVIEDASLASFQRVIFGQLYRKL